MKVIGVAGSPRREKSSHFLVDHCLRELVRVGEASGEVIETELIGLATLEFSGCISCNKCKKGLLCSQEDDFQPLLKKFADPELVGIVVSTPVYMGSMTSQTKAFLDRTVAHRRNGFLFRDIIGGAIAVGGSRNGGQELTVQGIHAAMMIHDMIIVGNGSHFGGMAWGNFPGGYEEDALGVETAKQLGARIAHLAMKLKK